MATPQTPPKLTAHNLRSAVLKGVSLALHPGQGMAVVGPSGSGKSSLFRALADLDPNTGRVSLDGRSREDFRPETWRRRVCYVPAEPAWWMERAGDHMNEAATQIARQLGLADDMMDKPVAALSTGERQRLALALGFAREPDVLLLDEPTSALDDDSRDRVEMLIRQALERGAALLMASHDPAQVERMAFSILTIADGRMIGDN